MQPLPNLPADPLVLLIAAIVVGGILTLALLALRASRRTAARRQPLQAVAPEAIEAAAPAPKRSIADSAALLAAVGEAEAEGEGASGRLAGLYFSLAQWRLESGETASAQDLLRKSIRNATTTGQKDTHAKARVALGDLAQASGDPATACEHWQIARLLFHELRQLPEYDAVDARMQRNGCPTDWVLTDF